MPETLENVSNIDDDVDLPNHPVVDNGIQSKIENGGCQLRIEGGTSIVQTLPKGVTGILDLDIGQTPKAIVHPEINAVTFVYR